MVYCLFQCSQWLLIHRRKHVNFTAVKSYVNTTVIFLGIFGNRGLDLMKMCLSTDFWSLKDSKDIGRWGRDDIVLVSCHPELRYLCFPKPPL